MTKSLVYTGHLFLPNPVFIFDFTITLDFQKNTMIYGDVFIRIFKILSWKTCDWCNTGIAFNREVSLKYMWEALIIIKNRYNV